LFEPTSNMRRPIRILTNPPPRTPIMRWDIFNSIDAAILTIRRMGEIEIACGWWAG